MENNTLLFKQSMKHSESLQSCWSDGVPVFCHPGKFLRLLLQLISRYITPCLSSGLAAREASVGSSRAPVESEWALFVPVEDFIYVRHICMILFFELFLPGDLALFSIE